MRIALFSDIHANLPAFEAFLSDLDCQKPDAVYCLGDLIGYNIWPNEIVNEIRNRRIPTLAGNHDLKVKDFLAVDQLQSSGKNYAYHIVDEDNRSYLKTLPAHIKLEFRLNDKNISFVLVHGSPRSVNEYVLQDSDENYVLQLMQEAGADVLCVGHSHKPYHRIIKSEKETKQVINIGSVGKPKDGNPQGCYVILTINDVSNIQVDFVRFDYDIEKAAKAIENSPLPIELADRLRKAY